MAETAGRWKFLSPYLLPTLPPSMGAACSSSSRLDRVAPNVRPPPGPVEAIAAAAPARSAPAAAPSASAAAHPADAAALRKEFLKALKAGNTVRVAELLEAGADMEHRGMWENTPLLVACHYAHSPVALELLRRGANPSASNERGCTPLVYACVERLDEVPGPAPHPWHPFSCPPRVCHGSGVWAAAPM